MSRQTGVDSQEVQQDKSADSGKALQNPRGSDCPWLASKAIGNLPYWPTSRECAADGLERLGFGWAKHGNSRNGISSKRRGARPMATSSLHYVFRTGTFRARAGEGGKAEERTGLSCQTQRMSRGKILRRQDSAVSYHKMSPRLHDRNRIVLWLQLHHELEAGCVRGTRDADRGNGTPARTPLGLLANVLIPVDHQAYHAWYLAASSGCRFQNSVQNISVRYTYALAWRVL